jgi:hypothetical protein
MRKSEIIFSDVWGQNSKYRISAKLTIDDSVDCSLSMRSADMLNESLRVFSLLTEANEELMEELRDHLVESFDLFWECRKKTIPKAKEDEE